MQHTYCCVNSSESRTKVVREPERQTSTVMILTVCFHGSDNNANQNQEKERKRERDLSISTTQI
jgi:poly(3-hydroxybutyrate) depolymerase